MKCPKCEFGAIRKILFHKSQTVGYLCDFCGTVWLESEEVSERTGHRMYALTKDDDFEYSFFDAEKDPDAKPVVYPRYK